MIDVSIVEACEKYSPQPFTIDHIIPLALGGETQIENLALACGGCNGYKYIKTEAIDPVSLNIVPLFHLRNNKWSDHFEWNPKYTHVIGITSIGRATVATLKLNRAELINLREITQLTGEHPPK